MRQLSLLSIALVLFLIPLNTTHASPCTFTRLLYEGVQGIDVQCLQNFLKTKGYFTGVPTGLYGPSTKVAVSTWQHASGVIVTPKEYGLFGEQSRVLYAKQIATMPSPPTAPKTTTTTKKKKTATTSPVCVIKRTLTVKTVGTDVTCLQTYLKANGFFKGTPDGIYASSTKAAVSSFQTKNKIKVKKTDQGTFEKESLSAYKKLSKGKKAGGGGGGGGGGGSSSDTTAPTTPTSLSASAVTQTTLTLSWTASTDSGGVSGYNVYKDGSLLTSGITGTTYGVTGLTLNTAYSFTVLAYDSAGNLSTQSSALATTTLPDTTEPTTPGNATFSSVTTSAITLSWTASTDAVGVSGYRIYRGATQVGTTTLLTLTNSSLSSGTSSSYTIEAYDAAGNRSSRSATTSTSTLTVDTTAPTVPGVISFSLVTASTLRLAFASSTDAVGVSGYRIYRDGIQVGTSTFASFNDLGLVASTTYAYTVSAYDAANNISVRNATTSTTTTVAVDTTAPSTPGAITFSSVSSTTITLRWASSTDAVGVTGYKVYLGGVQVATATVALYTNTGLTASTSYSYTIAAYDVAGNVSTRNATTSTSTVGSGVASSSMTLTSLYNFQMPDNIGGDGAGEALAYLGDINNDGYDDIAVGAPSAVYGTSSVAGVLYVVLGGATRSSNIDLDTLNGTNGGYLLAGFVGDNLGDAVAGAGDVDGDGLNDIVFGAPAHGLNHGEAYITFGATTSLNTLNGFRPLNFNPASGSFPTNNGMVLAATTSTVYGIRTGEAVAGGGDFDGDGFKDTVVGMPLIGTTDTVTDDILGRVYIVFGRATGFTNVSLTLGGATGTRAINLDGSVVSGQAGRSVAMGTIDNDSLSDVLIAAPGINTVYMVAGNAVKTARDNLDLNTLNGSNGGAKIVGPSSIGFGTKVINIGDVNSDGRDDILILAPTALPVSGGSYSGVAYVIFGTSTTAMQTINVASLNGTNGFTVHGASFVPAFGTYGGLVDATGVDINGDGFKDIVLTQTLVPQGVTQLGETYVLYGKSGSFSDVNNLNLDTGLNGTNGFKIVGVDDGVISDANISRVSNAGDMNNDGFEDLMLGLPGGGPVNGGTVYVIYGRASF